MSSPTPPQTPAATIPPPQKEIKIVSHSNLFYWWPVWAIGFILSVLTWWDGHRMAIVPPGTQAIRDATIKGHGETFENRDVLVVPKGTQLPPVGKEKPDDPHLHVSMVKSYGVLYAIVLLLVIVITNVPLRGLWSVVVIVAVVLLSVIFSLATINDRTIWDHIFEAMSLLRIHINAAGYLVISTGLLIIWLVTFLFFDPQIYMVFNPKQLRVRQEIGGGESAYDTTGMVIQKQRNDLFRHWVLGLGSGDLIVNTSGAATHHFDMANVLFVGYKLRQIEDMLREVQVTA